MKFVIQRVTHASVKVDGEIAGKIGKGFMVLIGVSQTDTTAEADRLIKKMLGLRIFDDENGKTNLALADVGGELLLISQCHCKARRYPVIKSWFLGKYTEIEEFGKNNKKKETPTTENESPFEQVMPPLAEETVNTEPMVA